MGLTTGSFEMIDLANAMDIEPVITTHCEITPQDYADLVEYAWGNSSTTWGKIRVQDGHPDPYRVR